MNSSRGAAGVDANDDDARRLAWRELIKNFQLQVEALALRVTTLDKAMAVIDAVHGRDIKRLEKDVENLGLECQASAAVAPQLSHLTRELEQHGRDIEKLKRSENERRGSRSALATVVGIASGLFGTIIGAVISAWLRAGH